MVEHVQDREVMHPDTHADAAVDDQMDLTKDSNDPIQEDFDFESMMEETFTSYERGEIIKGTVLKVSSDDVVVDIGSKSEGMIPLKEFLEDGKDPNVYVGMEVDVMVMRREGSDGLPILSRSRAKELMARQKLDAAFRSGTYVECVVKTVVKGGFEVSVDGLRGFIPFSQMGLGVKTPEERKSLVGKKVEAKILEMPSKRDLVLSNRAAMEEKNIRMRKATLEKLRVGARVKGIVKNVTDFGAFIDLGGLDGLLHINDMSWKRVNNPLDVVGIGNPIEVIVLNIEEERISLGLKQKSRDPWLSVHDRFPPGTVANGIVKNLEKYGAFVELEEGIEGLIHISELSWVKRIKHPSEVLKTGDRAPVKVLSIDDERKRIALSLRQTEVDPWTLAKANYPPGSIIEGEVTGMTDFGAFVRLPEGIDGMIHVSDMSWEQKINNPKQVLNKGDRVRAKVLEIVPEEKRIALGLKQMEGDPWETVAHKFRIGDNVDVKVTRVTDFGAFVELERGVEGLAHSSTLVMEKGKAPRDVVHVGEQLTMKIIKFDLSGRRISLSLKDYVKEQEKQEVEKYMSKDEGATATLGELLGEQMRKLMHQSQEPEAKPVPKIISPDEEAFFNQAKKEDETPEEESSSPESPDQPVDSENHQDS